MTLVIAHRGASAAEPENSLAAFRRAVAMGTDGIELDVHGTADGTLVVVHDDVLDGKLISQLSLAEVGAHRLKNGEVIPTLTNTLAAIGSTTKVFVEVKALPAARDQLLLDALDAGPAPLNYHVHSFDHRIIQRLQRRAPKRIYGVLSCSYLVNPMSQTETAGATELWQHESMIDADLVRAAHGARRTVYAWTVDDPARIKALQALAVDGICTNQPDLARSVLG